MQNCEWCNCGGFHISALEIILRKCICQGKLWLLVSVYKHVIIIIRFCSDYQQCQASLHYTSSSYPGKTCRLESQRTNLNNRQRNKQQPAMWEATLFPLFLVHFSYQVPSEFWRFSVERITLTNVVSIWGAILWNGIHWVETRDSCISFE